MPILGRCHEGSCDAKLDQVSHGHVVIQTIATLSDLFGTLLRLLIIQ